MIMRRPLMIPFLAALYFVPCHAQDEAPFPAPPDTLSSRAAIVSADEPGEKLVISGTVYASDGKTPFAGLILYFYQTDLSGVYNRTTGSWRSPRLHGWIRTDANGRYELMTIKPGSYPNRRDPAHIHVTVKLPGAGARWLDAYLFEGDPFLSDAEKKQARNEGNFSPVLKLRKSDDGVLTARRDIILPAPR